MKARILLASALVTLVALPAAGQSVKISFHGGKIDLAAENASLRAILNEWARVGGTRVVNADRVAEIRSDAHGDFDVTLAGGKVLRMTRNFSERLMGR